MAENGRLLPIPNVEEYITGMPPTSSCTLWFNKKPGKGTVGWLRSEAAQAPNSMRFSIYHGQPKPGRSPGKEGNAMFECPGRRATWAEVMDTVMIGVSCSFF